MFLEDADERQRDTLLQGRSEDGKPDQCHRQRDKGGHQDRPLGVRGIRQGHESDKVRDKIQQQHWRSKEVRCKGCHEVEVCIRNDVFFNT